MNARATVATFGEFARNGLGVPLLVMVVLAMMVLPLPAFLLDIFFTFNISDAQSSRIGNVLELLATLFAGWQGSARRKF